MYLLVLFIKIHEEVNVKNITKKALIVSLSELDARSLLTAQTPLMLQTIPYLRLQSLSNTSSNIFGNTTASRALLELGVKDDWSRSIRHSCIGCHA